MRLLLAALLALGCSTERVVGPAPPSATGEWLATNAFFDWRLHLVEGASGRLTGSGTMFIDEAVASDSFTVVAGVHRHPDMTFVVVTTTTVPVFTDTLAGAFTDRNTFTARRTPENTVVLIFRRQ